MIHPKGRVQKKTLNPWAWSYLEGWGGSAGSQCSHLLRFFLHAPNLFFWTQRNPKTDFVFTPNSIFHIVSHLSDTSGTSDSSDQETCLPRNFVFLKTSFTYKIFTIFLATHFFGEKITYEKVEKSNFDINLKIKFQQSFENLFGYKT